MHQVEGGGGSLWFRGQNRDFDESMKIFAKWVVISGVCHLGAGSLFVNTAV